MAKQPTPNENFRQPRLPPGQQLIRDQRWPYVGERQCIPAAGPWTISIGGLVRQSMQWTLDQLGELPQTCITTDIHCVTRWSKFEMTFGGVLLADLLEKAGIGEGARYVSFIGRTERKHSSSLSLSDALEQRALIATHVDQRPLSADHGGPLRSIVPNKYFYKSVKWLERLEILAEDRLGFWESDSGYHNHADPWQEERYIAPAISRRLAAELIGSKDFSRQDLQGIDASDRDLQSLNAEDALLRNANFSGCNLAAANFRGANLSNASFRDAQLVGADFTGGDLEGVDFSGADLRGAILLDCSLFGASFCMADDDYIGHAAKLDPSTRLAESQLDALITQQREFVERSISTA